MEDLPAPTLEAGGALVKVRAASVNFPDVLLVANQYQIKVPLPFVPGSEFAGEIVAIADGVPGLAVGQRVFGTTFVGAFAEEVAVPAQALRRTPPTVSDRDAAAFGVAHGTAYNVLKSVARVGPGDQLVVLGAGGGVGLASVQLGALLGAKVTAVASSPEKLEAARSVGAGSTIDYRRSELRQALRELLPEGADAVVDPVGGALSEPALRSLRWGGRYVTVGFASGEIPKIALNLVLLKGVHILGFEYRSFAQNAPSELRQNDTELMAMLESGRVRPYIGASFTLEETPSALRHVAEGKAIGKVVIDVAGTFAS